MKKLYHESDFDEARDSYILITLGWDRKTRVHGCLFVDRKAQRQRWIDDLRAGKPSSAIFTKEVLEQLRKQ